MDCDEFEHRVCEALRIGTVLNNPGGGTSAITGLSGGKLAYRRRRSTIRVALRDLYDAYAEFRGRRLSGPDLRIYSPSVFDSAKSGHSCNVTFLFLVLKSIGAVEHICGAGKRGDPFYVIIPD
ncbi:MAG TPA: hypothetical protein VGM37_09425 [Armatimonadota bacterium]|jgi:hypothetical protein